MGKLNKKDTFSSRVADTQTHGNPNSLSSTETSAQNSSDSSRRLASVQVAEVGQRSCTTTDCSAGLHTCSERSIRTCVAKRVVASPTRPLLMARRRRSSSKSELARLVRSKAIAAFAREMSSATSGSLPMSLQNRLST